VRQFLRQHGLPLVEEKLGDSHPRRVMYFPGSGTALVKRLPSRYAASVANREMQYFNSVGPRTNEFGPRGNALRMRNFSGIDVSN